MTKVLTDDEKELLSDLMKHRGFKVLISCINDFRDNVRGSLEELNLANEEDCKVLKEKQNYLKGLKDLQKTLDSKTNTIGKRDFN